MRLREVLVNLQAEFDQIQKIKTREKEKKKTAKAKKALTAKQMQDIKDAVAAEECGLVPKY